MNRTTVFNNENLPHLQGKRVVTQNIKNQRQPLGNYTCMNVVEKNLKHSTVDVETLKTRTEGVQTRSQTARQDVHSGIGRAVKYSKPTFTIFEDIEQEVDDVVLHEQHESMEIVEERAVLPLPQAFNDSLMADESLQCDEDDEDEAVKEEMDDEEEEEYEDDGEVSYAEERTEDDVEMMNVIRKQKAVSSIRYAEEHQAYSMTEYRQAVYKNMREKELLYMPKANYMSKQTDLNKSMRIILIDWMVEVSEEYRLKRETLFLAVSYVDRYLSHLNINRTALQLVGTTALFIAAKFEEVYPPPIKEFVTVTDNTYEVRQILTMEYSMLKALNFHFTVPTSNFFCLDLLNLFSVSKVDYAMSYFILETALIVGNEFLGYRPSVLAATSVLISSLVLRRENCMKQITSYTGYVIEDLLQCIESVFQTFQNTEILTQTAVKNKFAREQYQGVSELSIPKGLSLNDFLTGNY